MGKGRTVVEARMGIRQLLLLHAVGGDAVCANVAARIIDVGIAVDGGSEWNEDRTS
jgi:hypothetical protein